MIKKNPNKTKKKTQKKQTNKKNPKKNQTKQKMAKQFHNPIDRVKSISLTHMITQIHVIPMIKSQDGIKHSDDFVRSV